MKQLIQFFYPKKQLNYFDQLKTNSLIVILLLSIFLLIAIITYSEIFKPENYKYIILGGYIYLALIFIYLFILKYTNIQVTGNIFTLVNVIVIASLMVYISPKVPIVYKYVGEFYIIFGVFSGSVLFASRKVMIINAIIIFAAFLKTFIYTWQNAPEYYGILKTAIPTSLVALSLLFLYIYLTNLFSEKNIKRIIEVVNINREQNKILLEVLKNIENISQEILKSSQLLSETSKKLSENAAEQAATTEEISSSMEEMLASVQANNEKSEYTSKITNKISEKLEQNKDLILKALNAVNDISNKITEISEIANKTDILSINAAIEAARAGESGKGFAVVAQEIRKLSDRTQKLASDITKLSINNITLSKKASNLLELIIPEIIKSAEMIQNIALASKEQESNIESINNSILQLSTSTNENSASAEELSAASEQLLAHAKKLKDLSTSSKNHI